MLALCASIAVALLAADTPHWRPALHFTPPKNWTNDPNGLVFVDGEYHIFYQYNPFGDQWGHMSWGHAVSKDLFAWEHLPVAIPENGPIMAFSGSAVLDRANTTGFGTVTQPPMVAIYTGHNEHAHRQHQNIAYSIDRGRTWKEFSRNPVIDLNVADFRDPKVFWHEPTRRWIMVVALAADRKALFYSSSDLKSWNKLSEFGPQGRTSVPNWECPEFFELPLEGEKGESRWILVTNVGSNGPNVGSGVQYFVGRFDGTTFTNDNSPDTTLWLDRGPDFYAFQSYNDAPDNRRIGLAWMATTAYTSATPTSPWRGSMTIPRELKLRKTPDGLRLSQLPPPELALFLSKNRGHEATLSGREISAAEAPLDVLTQVALIEAEFEPGDAHQFGLQVRKGPSEFTAVGYNVDTSELYIDRANSGKIDIHPSFAQVTAAPFKTSGHIKLTIVIDRSSVEAFAGDGLASISNLIFPQADDNQLALFAVGGTCRLHSLRIISLKD